MQKKKVIIIGAGISGMTAGIYLLDNNFDVEIYEKHFIPGGECTGWFRNGIYIDGCAHWVVGTNKKSDFYPIWEHIGALNDDLKVYESDYFIRYHFDDDVVTIYSDLNKLYKELIRVAPEDKKMIEKVCNNIEAYQYVRVPVNKPIDMMNLFELTAHGLKMMPLLSAYNHSRKESMKDLSEKFKNERLKTIIHDMMADEEYNSHSIYYSLGMLSKKDAGTPEGGSLQFAKRISDRFIKKGGVLHLNSTVKRVLIENDTATGIELENGENIKGDYIVASGDMHHTFDKLIGHKYMSKFYKELYEKKEDYLLNTTFFISYKITEKNSHLDKSDHFYINPITIGEQKIRYIRCRSHTFDTSINENSNCLTIMMNVGYSAYEFIKSLDRESYLKYKNELGEYIKNELIRIAKINPDNITLLDVATPLTYERYTNAYKGSYMAFITTKRSKGLFQPNYNKSLKNFVFAGQWLMPPGGLPPAALTGKYAAIRIAKLNKQKFINKENKKAQFYTCKRDRHN